jgi:hypothetical protein
MPPNVSEIEGFDEQGTFEPGPSIVNLSIPQFRSMLSRIKFLTTVESSALVDATRDSSIDSSHTRRIPSDERGARIDDARTVGDRPHPSNWDATKSNLPIGLVMIYGGNTWSVVNTDLNRRDVKTDLVSNRVPVDGASV